MESFNLSQSWCEVIAKAADVCLKPWRHAVVGTDNMPCPDSNLNDLKIGVQQEPLDFVVRIESRDSEGLRHPDRDLELEVYRSGNDVNLLLSWFGQPERPILWQGKHPVWMDGINGKKCVVPIDGELIESLARRLKALLETSS
ncbi:hypothetical protein [Prochlorococcus sp. MIT 1341]|uniref:hypothetical protein n=1 Tax=Prochlorococcus sp. MIT 1341 TaxID=3096221 RepID=UPI002A75D1BA|nr:hypothetical protein [Prochlorococcus sp. MIT 1341]